MACATRAFRRAGRGVTVMIGPTSDPAGSGTRDDDGQRGAMRTIARSGSVNAAGALVGAMSNFLLVVLIARWWSPAEAGGLFAATSVFIIAVALCHLGVDQGLVRFLAWNVGKGGDTKNRGLTLWALVPVLALALAVAGAGWFGAPLLQSALGDSAAEGELIVVVRVLAVSLPFAVLYEELLAITRGYARMRATVVLERVLRPCLQVVCVVVAAQVAPSISVLAVAWVLPYLVCVVLAGVAAHGTIRAMPRDAHWARPERAALSEFWRFTAPRGAARLAQIGIQRLDIVIVSFLAGPAAAAIYTSVTRFLVLGQTTTAALQQVSEPQLAKLLGADKLGGAAAVVRQMTLWSTMLAIPLYLSIAVHADTLLGLVFGPDYVSGSALLRLLCVAMIIGVCCGPVDVLLLMAGRSSLSLVNTMSALFVDVLLCFLLVPSLSYFGAGVAWAAAILVKNAMACIQVWRHLGVTVFTARQARWAAGLVVAFGLLPWVLSELANHWVALGASVTIGCGFLLWMWRNRARLLHTEAQVGG